MDIEALGRGHTLYGARGLQPRTLLALLLGGVLLMHGASPARAQFQDCPTQDGRRVCQISLGRSTLTVAAASGVGPVLQVESWIVDGVEQMGVEAIRVRDGESGTFPDFELFSAEIVIDTVQILLFHELEDGGLSTAFTLREIDDVPTMFIEIFITSGSGTASGQVFLVSDLNLGGDPDDVYVGQGSQGLPITQIGTLSQSLLIFERGAPPTSLDVGLASEFAPLLSNQLVTLDDTKTALGPADLGSAIAWEAQITPSEPFQAELRRTLLVPEPGAVPSAVAALAVVAALTRAERRARARTQPTQLAP